MPFSTNSCSGTLSAVRPDSEKWMEASVCVPPKRFREERGASSPHGSAAGRLLFQMSRCSFHAPRSRFHTTTYLPLSTA